MQEKVEPNEWYVLRSALELRSTGLASGEHVADAIQDALLALVIARKAGVVIRDEIGWCLVIVRCRAMDAYRRRRREVVGADMETVPAAETPRVDWGRALRDAGIELSDGAVELLARITSGYRGNHALAECLGRDVKTIRERRRRLVSLLRRVLADFRPTPPLMSDQGVATETGRVRESRAIVSRLSRFPRTASPVGSAADVTVSFPRGSHEITRCLPHTRSFGC